jgi:hypothetical protein
MGGGMALNLRKAGHDPETMKFTPEEIDVVRKQSQTP